MGETVSEHTYNAFDDDFFQFVDCIVVELDRLGSILRMNPFAENYFGRNASEISGEPFVGTLVPERFVKGKNQIAAIENFVKLSENGGSFELEVRLSDGTQKNVTWSATVHFGSNAEMDKIILIGVDRSVCMKREHDLQRKYGLLESFLEASNVSAFAVDSEHRVFYMSPGIKKVIGYLPEEILGRTPDIFFETEESKRITDLMAQEILKGTRDIHLVNQIRHKDGASVWCEMNETLSYLENGEFAGLVGLSRNIDEQKKYELALSEREKEFRFCIKHAQVLLTVTDEKGVIRSINRVGAKMYGKQPEEMVGHVFTEFLPDFERERALRAFKKDFRSAMAKKDRHTVGMGGIINKIRTPDGLKDILFFKTGVKIYKDEKFEGILNTAVDITEIVKVREELKRHRNHLEQLVAERTAELQGLQEEMVRRERLTALGKMADVISQEIRTPLSTISNSLFVINECLREKELGVKRSLERANRAIKRCYSIVDEFKLFTQIDQLKKKSTEIDPWLNGILEQLSEEKGTSVVQELDSGVTVNIDRDRIQRAVVNVLENARQAVQDLNENRIVVKSKLAFNRLEIEIADEGVGIKRKDLEKVFEPLFSTKSFGLGLGLPISRQIMEQHGGGISIESKEKEGTKVLLWLPVDQTV